MENYLEQREQLEDLFCVDATTPGCRMELVEEMISEWGMSIDDLVGRFSDMQIVEAIHNIMQINGSICQLEAQREENFESGSGPHPDNEDSDHEERRTEMQSSATSNWNSTNGKRPMHDAKGNYIWT